MISEETTQTLRRLLSEQATYRPTVALLKQLQHVDFSCFVGAGCMGKTAIMDALSALSPDYGKTYNFTTRPPRPDDDPSRYYYFLHTDEGLRPIFQRIQTGKLLQYNIDPFSLYMYGSEVEGYPHHYNTGDIWSSSIDGFRQLGFGKLRVFSVVTDPDSWATRFALRFQLGNSLREARLKEAALSLRWSLAQTDSDHAWVFNPTDQIELAAASVDRIVRGKKPTQQPEAEALAKQCLQRAKEMLACEK